MLPFELENKRVGQQVATLAAQSKLEVDPGIFMVVLANLQAISETPIPGDARVKVEKNVPSFAYGKALKVRPKRGNKPIISSMQTNIFGLFILQYHISQGGTLKNLTQKVNQYILRGSSVLGGQNIPKKHRMSAEIKKWCGMSDQLEEILYRLQNSAPIDCTESTKYADYLLKQILLYLDSLK